MLAGIYALLTVGLSFIYGIARIMQMSHGQIYMLGAYCTFIFSATLGVNFYASILLSGVVVGLFSLLLERWLFRPLKSETLATLIIGIALMLGLEGGIQLIFGAREYPIANPLPGAVKVLGAFVPKTRLLIVVVSVVMISVLILFLKRTKTGNAMRAVAQNPDAASLLGINVNVTRLLCFGIASGLAGLAGGLMMTIAPATPVMGSNLIIKAFLAMIIGGMGSLYGAILGASALAVIDSVGFTFIGHKAALLGYMAVVIILIIRPRGLLGGTF